MRAFIGRHVSTRGKLTLWYGSMVALTFIVAGAATALAVERQFSNSIDSNLEHTTGNLRNKLSSPFRPGEGPSAALPPESLCQDPSIAGYFTRVQNVLTAGSGPLSQPGQFVEVIIWPEWSDPRFQCSVWPQGTQAQAESALPTVNPYTFISTVATGGHRFVDIPGRRGDTWRVDLTPLRVPPQVRPPVLRQAFTTHPAVRAYLVVYQNERTYADVADTVRRTLLVTGILGLLVAIIAGWWIARAALRPIGRISRTVRSIGESKDLSRRLNFVGPDDEVGRLAETFDGMMERLERVFDTQKRFIADASHELRTPLTAIRGNADLMRIAPPEERDLCLASIRKESERMTRLVSDLLLLAEADVAEHPVHLERVDLDELLVDVYHSVLVVAQGRVHVALEPTESLCVEGDPDRLKQLLLNLSDNAVKFTPEGGTVSLSLRRRGNQACVAVSDSGIGIAREDQDAIFDRFYRVEEARSRRGSGLGLAISAWIARAHGGSIEVQSEPGKGSTFTVVLPLAPESVSPRQKPAVTTQA